MRAGDGCFTIAEGTVAPNNSQHVQVRIEDAKGHCERARQNGVIILSEPQDHPYGERQYNAQDFYGHRWDFTETIADVAPARSRLDAVLDMVKVFMASFPLIRESLRKTFNTATMQFAINGKFEPTPLKAEDLERILAHGFKLPVIDVPIKIQPFAERWWTQLTEELQPLAGKSIDPRFIEGLHLEMRT